MHNNKKIALKVMALSEDTDYASIINEIAMMKEIDSGNNSSSSVSSEKIENNNTSDSSTSEKPRKRRRNLVSFYDAFTCERSNDTLINEDNSNNNSGEIVGGAAGVATMAKEKQLWICMEYMAGGCLTQMITVIGVLEEPVIAYLCREILKGLAYLHSEV